jgi:hypothetical protein
MAKRKLSGNQIHKMIVADEKAKLDRERIAFGNWFRDLKDKDQMSQLKISWEAWKQRAGVRVPSTERGT